MGNPMKISRLMVRLVFTPALLLFLGATPQAGARNTSVFPTRLDARIGALNPPGHTKARHRGAHRKAMTAPVTRPAVVTEDGPVKGSQMGDTLAFLGIPYAAPPIGKLRWMPPQPHGKFNGVFQANTFGSFCTQPGGSNTIGSEDCLTLNVFTPISRKNANKNSPLPVMVWIHGGGLVTGASFLYFPDSLVANGNVIVVTINYRLGFLGFFAHPAIDSEGHLDGNYGLMDQQFALQWVNRNIAAFGGDPNRVTIFGESAGGQSVYSNLASPTAAGLFGGAIAESGAYVEFQNYFDFIVPLARGETAGTMLVPSGTAIASSVGCGSQTAQCLRGVPASTLVSTEPGTIFPFVDGTILARTPTAAFTSGQFNQVPVISGGNHDEWRIFVDDQYDAAGHPLVTETDYENATNALFTPALGPILFTSIYPLAAYPSPGVALGTSGTDGIFACPERNSVRLLSQHVPTFAYEFNDENAPALFEFHGSFPLGAYHSAELQYLFDLNQRFAGFNPFTPGQQQLSNAMVSYWTTFAANGDPNSAGEPVWSQYSSSTDQFQSLVPPAPGAESTFDADHKCSLFWNTF
jgi:para-nitrobenzyl esterase